MTTNKFYIWRGVSDDDGNMLWWKHNDGGYVPELRNARQFTGNEIVERQTKCPEAHRKKTAFNAEIVEKVAVEGVVREEDMDLSLGVKV